MVENVAGLPAVQQPLLQHPKLIILGSRESRAMSSFSSNPFNDPFNPYAAPETSDIAMEVSGNAVLATRWLRFCGAFVDGLTMIPISVGLLFVLRYSNQMAGATLQAPWLVGLAMLPITMGWYLLLNGYLLSKKGQTLGKAAVGTQIVDAQTEKLLPLFPMLLKRNVAIGLLGIIPFVGSFISLLDALLIFRSNRRCLHDDIAGTKVILFRNPANP